MKKSKPRPGAKRKAQAALKNPEQVQTEARRNALRLIRNGAIGAAVLGGAGVFSVNAVRATVAQQDLAQVGNGTPAIVQIHDPSCSLCTELQRQTRRALRGFDEGAVNYLVANIQTEAGSAFAARHGAGHVTLLLFDGDGRRADTLEGVRQRDELRPIFEAHLARTGS